MSGTWGLPERVAGVIRAGKIRAPDDAGALGTALLLVLVVVPEGGANEDADGEHEREEQPFGHAGLLRRLA
jgi:hypothetical protein